MESNLVQINVIRCKSIIIQMNTSAQRMFMSLQRIFILVKDDVHSVLRISSAQNKGGPLDINIVQILHLFELKYTVYIHLSIANQKSVRYSVSISYFWNIAVQNVNKVRACAQEWTSSLIKKSNCQTFVYIPPQTSLYCINSLGPHFGVFESLHKEKHINSIRNCVKYILDRSVKSRHFETELNMSLEHSIIGVWNCARAHKCMG
jgi:hypothetical protein